MPVYTIYQGAKQIMLGKKISGIELLTPKSGLNRTKPHEAGTNQLMTSLASPGKISKEFATVKYQ